MASGVPIDCPDEPDQRLGAIGIVEPTGVDRVRLDIAGRSDLIDHGRERIAPSRNENDLSRLAMATDLKGVEHRQRDLFDEPEQPRRVEARLPTERERVRSREQ
jgi:hypothetical protein